MFDVIHFIPLCLKQCFEEAVELEECGWSDTVEESFCVIRLVSQLRCRGVEELGDFSAAIQLSLWEAVRVQALTGTSEN